jgi:nucleoid-associated protein YgaU
LGNSPERPNQQPPNHTIVAGGVPQGTGEHRPAPVTAADADMQNLFPNEGAPQHDRPTPNPQNLAGRGTPLEPAGMNRTAQLQDPTAQVRPGQIAVAQTQPGQVQSGRTPPTQSEPLDNEALEDSHSPAHAALGERGVAHMQPDSRGPKPDAGMSAIPSAGTAKTGRAEALLAGKEREQSGDDSPFGNSASPTYASRGVPQPTDRSHSTLSPVQTSNTTNIPGAGARSPSASDDPFGGDRSSANGRFAEKSGPTPSAERGLWQPGRLASGVGSVTAVGTTNDADYYVVQPQDNFWSISRKKYGTSRYFHALAELNKERIPDAGRMRPGMKVSTPPAEMLEEHYSQFLPPGTKVQVTAGEDAFAKVTPTGFLVSPDGTPKYRTGEHDTLSEIAAKHLGRSSRWIQIYEMNRDKLSNPNQLKVGTELVLPGDASSIGMSNEEDDRR